MQELSQSLTTTMSRLIAQQPMFSCYLYDLMTLHETDTIQIDGLTVGNQTAATDGSAIWINPEFFDGITLDARIYVLCHEILHGIMLHCPRLKLYLDRGFGPDLLPFNQENWAQAIDGIVNKVLDLSKVGERPPFGVFMDELTGDETVEDIYLELQKRKGKQKKKPGPGKPGKPGTSKGQSWDQHLAPQPGSKQPSEAEVKRALRSARNAAKARGNMPAALDRLLGEILEPAVDWPEKLRNAMSQTIGYDQATWSKSNRRRLAIFNQIYPGSQSFRTGGVVVGIDTSGSVSEKELNQFMGELSSILEDTRPEWCRVYWCDSKVAHIDDVEYPSDLETLTAHGGGGTHMPAIFEKIQAEEDEPETCVILTDGETDFGEAPEDYNVIWGITSSRIVAPHGESIHIDVQ